MPYYLEAFGYVIYDTDICFGSYLLDCNTGRIIYQGDFDIDTAIEGMSKDHSKSCFIFKIDVDDHTECILTDSTGNSILPEEYVGRNKKIQFLSNESFGGIRPIFYIEKGKFGLLRYFQGECRMIISPKYSSIHMNGAIKDKKGDIYYPTFRATYMYRKKKEKFFDLNGKELHI